MLQPRTLAPGEQLVAVEDRGPFFERMTDAQFARLRALYEADAAAEREAPALRLTLPVGVRFSEGTEAAFDAVEAHVAASRAAPARDTDLVVRIHFEGDLFASADGIARVMQSEAQRALHDDFPR